MYSTYRDIQYMVGIPWMYTLYMVYCYIPLYMPSFRGVRMYNVREYPLSVPRKGEWTPIPFSMDALLWSTAHI